MELNYNQIFNELNLLKEYFDINDFITNKLIDEIIILVKKEEINNIIDDYIDKLKEKEKIMNNRISDQMKRFMENLIKIKYILSISKNKELLDEGVKKINQINKLNKMKNELILEKEKNNNL